MTDVRERHQRADVYIPVPTKSDGGFKDGDTESQCWQCRKPWPCDAIREADRADAAEADARREIEELNDQLISENARTAAARLDADRLAEALWDVLDDTIDAPWSARTGRKALAAIGAHDKESHGDQTTSLETPSRRQQASPQGPQAPQGSAEGRQGDDHDKEPERE